MEFQLHKNTTVLSAFFEGAISFSTVENDATKAVKTFGIFIINLVGSKFMLKIRLFCET